MMLAFTRSFVSVIKH